MLADDAHIVNCGAVSAAQFEAYIRRVERTDDDEPEYADSQVLVALAIELGKTIVILQPCGGYNHIDPTQWVPGAADKAVVIAAISEYDGPRASVGHYLAVNIAPHVNVGVGDLHMLRKEMWEREVGLPRYQAILDDPADRRDKTWIGGEIDRMRQELNNLRQQIVAAIQIVLVPKTLKAIPGLLSRDNDTRCSETWRASTSQRPTRTFTGCMPPMVSRRSRTRCRASWVSSQPLVTCARRLWRTWKRGSAVAPTLPAR